MARHATGDRRDETLKQGREEHIFSVAVVVLPISPHFLLGVAFVCGCVCTPRRRDHGTLNQGRDLLTRDELRGGRGGGRGDMVRTKVETGVGCDLFGCWKLRVRDLEFRGGGRDVEGTG